MANQKRKQKNVIHQHEGYMKQGCCKDKKPILRIEPGCIACGSCQFRAPEVFEVTDRSRINPDADLEKNDALIEEAVKACPVNVIKYDK